MSSGAWATGRAERLADRLVPEAHAEERDAGIRRRADDGDRGAGVGGRAGTGRDEHAAVGRDRARRVVDRVGLDEIGLGAELVEIPDEGVDEAVVVVDHEDGRELIAPPLRHWTVTSCGFTRRRIVPRVAGHRFIHRGILVSAVCGPAGS